MQTRSGQVTVWLAKSNILFIVKAYQQYLDVKYAGTHLEEYGVEDELSASEEPFEASFTRLMDITRIITANEEQSQVGLSSQRRMLSYVCLILKD